MSNLTTLFSRNREFSDDFKAADLPMIPKLRTVVLTCADARVDPAHIFKLDLGESVVMRNTGGRVTQEVIREIAAMAFVVAKMDGAERGPFELIIMQHTQCAAERFADPKTQLALREHVGVDVSSLAINDHEESLREDIEFLRKAPEIPNYIIVSGCIYDVHNGTVREVVKPAPLEAKVLF